MYIGFDFETQGFDPKNDAPTEIGVIVFNEKFEEIHVINHLIFSPLTKDQPKEIGEITGITNAMLMTAKHEGDVAAEIHPHFCEAKAIFAYNAPFDVSFLKEIFSRNGLAMPNVLVVDAQRDIEYPTRFNCKKLSHLCYDHGILPEQGQAHRAVVDVRMMLKLIAKYDLETIVKNAAEPKVQLRIFTEKPWNDKGESNEFAKASGFKFNPDTKFWVKQARESEVEQIIKGSKYLVEILK